MIHKIVYPALIIISIFLVISSYIKAYEAEMQTILAQETTQRIEHMQIKLQECAAIATEEAARADLAAKEAEKQAQIAQHQAIIAENEAAQALRLKMELARLKN